MKYFDISVQTLIYRKNGSLFANLGTIYWPNVNQQIVDWFTTSCKTTAFWLIGLPEVVGDQSFTLKYRTIVTSNGKLISDTTLLEFENLSYEDVVRFEYWVFDQLKELLTVFEKQHKSVPELTKKRSKLNAILNIFLQRFRNKQFQGARSGNAADC